MWQNRVDIGINTILVTVLKRFMAVLPMNIVIDKKVRKTYKKPYNRVEKHKNKIEKYMSKEGVWCYTRL